ncbi:MAG: arginine--tRNA ligase, partial [Thermodesulfobacteriota bacterium]
ARYAAGSILAGIRSDLAEFGATFENWFSEQSLYDAGKVDAAIADLKARQLAYEADGALWFRSTDYGDEKDRVVVRANGATTYFASDIAYHKDKYDRGLQKVVDVWGADHHGYIPRMRAAVAACGRPPEAFDVILVQLVNLLRDGVPVAMSSRAGEFVTLKDVVDEVGADAARFIFLTRHYDSKLDFDLELAKRKTNDNPVYYVQYVHARIASIIAKAAERGVSVPDEPDAASLERLDAPEEVALIKTLARFPEIVAAAGRMMEPHRITYYLLELAAAFHGYYNKRKVLTEDDGLTAGRLYLVRAIRRVIANGLSLLGVSAPDAM